MIARLRKDLIRNKMAYLFALPAVVLLFIFAYIPMYGIVVAFQDYRPALGFFNSPWVGLEHFRRFFTLPNAWPLFRNTLQISLRSILIGFPAPIIFAILLNELKDGKFKRISQTISYMPYFISLVVVAGMVRSFLSFDGMLNAIVGNFGIRPQSYLINPGIFQNIIVFTGLWMRLGWNSIIYLATLSGVDQQVYEAASVDGCGRLRKIWHVTLPGITPTIIILLILNIGSLLADHSSLILLLYSPLVFETGDVIGTYIFREGIQGGNFSFSAAIGLFQTVINFCLLILANTIAKKTSEHSLW